VAHSLSPRPAPRRHAGAITIKMRVYQCRGNHPVTIDSITLSIPCRYFYFIFTCTGSLLSSHKTCTNRSLNTPVASSSQLLFISTFVCPVIIYFAVVICGQCTATADHNIDICTNCAAVFVVLYY